MHLMELIDKNTITVIDLETSGLDCMRDYIIDVGGVKIGGWNKVKGKDGQALIDKGHVIGQFSSYVFCPIPLPGAIVDLTGITDADLKDAPKMDVVLKELKKFQKEWQFVSLTPT